MQTTLHGKAQSWQSLIAEPWKNHYPYHPFLVLLLNYLLAFIVYMSNLYTPHLKIRLECFLQILFKKKEKRQESQMGSGVFEGFSVEVRGV